MSNRFVILHHEAADGEHWDLMLEQGGVLLTWQLTREPLGRSDLPIPAGRIADHGTAYLDYEGSVSRNRGHVRRVDAGTVVFEPGASDECVIALQGGRLTGRFRLPVVGIGFLEAAGK